MLKSYKLGVAKIFTTKEVGFLFPFFIIFSFLLLVTFVLEKGVFLEWVNSHKNPSLDWIAIELSRFGNGWAIAFIFLGTVVKKYKYLSLLLLSLAINILLVLLLKKGIFNGALRPYLFYKEAGMLHELCLIDGVKIRYVNTFPSGHTATVVWYTSFLSIVFKNRMTVIILAVFALSVGLSRVYLLQHFLQDVTFGFLIGLISNILALFYIKHKRDRFFTGLLPRKGSLPAGFR